MGKHIIYDSEEQDSDIWFDDEKVNLNKELDTNILVIADLGLWNGRRSGYKIIGNNLSEILSVAQGDSYSVYFDSEKGDICATDIHHDGTNYYIFRQIRNGRNIDKLLSKIYDGNYSQEDIEKYTKSLGCHLHNIYGLKKDRQKKSA